MEVNSTSGDNVRSEIEAASSTYLDNTTRWKFGFDTSTFEEFLLINFPQYNEIQADTSLFSTTIIIDPVLDSPEIIWQTAGRKYNVSTQGIILGTLQSEQESNLPLVFDDAKLELNPGDRIASPQYVQFVNDMGAAAAEYGLVPQSIFAEASSRSLRVALEGKKYEVIVSTAIEPSEQWKSVVDLIANLNANRRGSPQEYIDTTIPGRLYWK